MAIRWSPWHVQASSHGQWQVGPPGCAARAGASATNPIQNRRGSVRQGVQRPTRWVWLLVRPPSVGEGMTKPSRSSLRRRIYTRPRAEAEAEPRRREVGRGTLEAKQQWGSPAVRPPFRWTSSGSPSAARSESDDKHLVAFLLPFRSKWGYFFFFSFSISGVALLFQLFRGVFSPLNFSSFRA